jgi:hypothetical protein
MRSRAIWTNSALSRLRTPPCGALATTGSPREREWPMICRWHSPGTKADFHERRRPPSQTIPQIPVAARRLTHSSDDAVSAGGAAVRALASLVRHGRQTFDLSSCQIERSTKKPPTRRRRGPKPEGSLGSVMGRSSAGCGRYPSSCPGSRARKCRQAECRSRRN